jgi:nucleoside-diphosphate-sugar epimerase
MLTLVTGSSGVLGSCLVSRLRERGEHVHLLDLVPDQAATADAGDLQFYRADVCDRPRVLEAARGVEVIYHLAAAQRMKPQFSAWNEQQIFERNLEGVRSVLCSAEECGVRKVVFISSSGVYGIPRTLPCTEDHPAQPLGAYGRSKLLAEGLCRDAVARGLDVTILRPMSLFGPRMTGIFIMLFEWVRTGRPVFLLGRGSNRVQTASAWDVADAAIRAAESEDARGGIFNLGAEPESVPTVLEMVKALIDHAGTGSAVVRIPALALRSAARALRLIRLSPIAPEHYLLADSDFVLDISAASERLGWLPRYDNVRMMIDAYQWYLDEGQAVQPPQHPLLRLMNRILPDRSLGAP